MIVKLNDKRLWVEGDKAYSIDEVKSRHEELTKRKESLNESIQVESGIIAEHSEYKANYENELNGVTYELDGVTEVLNKILEAEDAEANAVVEETTEEAPVVEEATPVEVVDEADQVEEDPAPVVEEVATPEVKESAHEVLNPRKGKIKLF